MLAYQAIIASIRLKNNPKQILKERLKENKNAGLNLD